MFPCASYSKCKAVPLCLFWSALREIMSLNISALSIIEEQGHWFPAQHGGGGHAKWWSSGKGVYKHGGLLRCLAIPPCQNQGSPTLILFVGISLFPVFWNDFRNMSGHTFQLSDLLSNSESVGCRPSGGMCYRWPIFAQLNLLSVHVFHTFSVCKGTGLSFSVETTLLATQLNYFWKLTLLLLFLPKRTLCGSYFLLHTSTESTAKQSLASSY